MYIKLSDDTLIKITNIRNIYNQDKSKKSIQIEADISEYPHSIDYIYEKFNKNIDSVRVCGEDGILLDTFVGYNFILNIEKYYFSNIGTLIIALST